MSPLRSLRQSALPLAPAAALAFAALLVGPALAASSSPEASVKLARDELEQQHFDKGRAAAEQATTADPKDYRGFYYLAMAELGLGHPDRARAAVDKALKLAPASARAGVAKLSGMVGSASSKASAAPAVVITCTYTSSLTTTSSPKDETPSENVVLFKIDGQALSYWDEKAALWQPFACPSIVREGWTSEHTCEVNERTFNFVRKEISRDSDDVQTDTVLVNRLTGASDWNSLSEYGPKQPKYPNLANTFFKIVRTGSCRSARDPAEAKPRF